MTQASHPLGSLPLSPDSLPSSQPIPLDEIPTSELVSAYLQAKTDIGRSPSTLAGYGWTLWEFAEANPFLPLDPVVIESYFASLSRLGDESIKDQCRRLVTFYKWLVRRRYIAASLDPFLMVGVDP